MGVPDLVLPFLHPSFHLSIYSSIHLSIHSLIHPFILPPPFLQSQTIDRALRAHTPRANDVWPTVHEHYTSRPAEWVQSVNHRHAEGKCTICRACEPCFAIWRVQKAVFLDISGFVVITSCTDAQIWRSGDFVPLTTTDIQTDYFIPAAHTCGVTTSWATHLKEPQTVCHHHYHQVGFMYVYTYVAWILLHMCLSANSQHNADDFILHTQHSYRV